MKYANDNKLGRGRLLSFLLAMIILLLSFPAAAWAEEEEARQPDGEEIVAFVRQVVQHLSMYARYDSVTERSLCKAALEKILREHPELYETAMTGMLESIDRYSEYYNPEETQKLMEDVSGEIVGIGVTLDFSGGTMLVVGVVPDTPAEKAGIQVGDVLVSADGNDLVGLNSEIAIRHVRGQAGTTVRIGVRREGREETLYFDMVREPIIGTSVRYEVVEQENQKLMNIRIYGFVKNTAEKLKEALDEADRLGITNLILDLRDNGGGLFDQAILMANYFVPKGKIITTEDHKIELLNKVYTADMVEENKYDVIILVNENSASASEVFTAALKENNVAQVIGTQTFGKGTIQNIATMQYDDAIKYTIGYYLTPEGNNIHEKGISPTAVVENVLQPVDMSKYPMYEYSRVYQKGDTGAEIKTAKEMLRVWGLYTGELNETFDEELESAIYSFQKAAEIFPYGVLDLTTQLQLRNRLAASKIVIDEQMRAAFDHFGMEWKEEQ